MSEELKLCSCGKNGGFFVSVFHNERESYPWYGYVMCKYCQCIVGDTGYSETEEIARNKAIRNWNTRPIEDELRAENAKLRKMISVLATNLENVLEDGCGSCPVDEQAISDVRNMLEE